MNGFARNASESIFHLLWGEKEFHLAPILGPTGLTVQDVSGKRHNVTLTNMAPSSDWTIDEMGYSLDFDAGDDRLIVDKTFTITPPYTLIVRIKESNSDNYGGLITESGSIGLFYRGTLDRISFFYSALDHLNSTAFSAATWHDVGLTAQADGSIIFYIDGMADGTASGAPDMIVTQIGNDTSNEAYGGKMSETRIYSRALTAREMHLEYEIPGAALIPASADFGAVTLAAVGRLMGALAGHGGLAGVGGLAGRRGGIAG